ncbi:MAG: (E)-4-hydroxy-3-methylbut-2-enyl-diphosphate synthase, partial [Chitinophagaceae bacterium]|nr:(E)-4-hydroxy-3-methylbut-2-enyl-diphosphate synthase [Chitinophagaceae bacterium]
KKKFELIEYTDADYAEEIDRIRERFTPLIKICKEYGTAMRIGTNHGSLSDRIMSRYGDTPMGMVESAMEFLRIARDETYHNIVLSMKASNPQVMVQAYRLLTKTMFEEFGECYPLHLGVTEAGDGEDGRIKSAIGIGTLMEDGLGDTIRVSLTEDPEFEIPVCRDIVKRLPNPSEGEALVSYNDKLSYNPFEYKRRETFEVGNIGNKHVPVVVADLSKIEKITHQHLQRVGYTYNETTDKWNISDAAADYIFTANQILDFELPGTLKVIVYKEAWNKAADKTKYFPIFEAKEFLNLLNGSTEKRSALNFVMLDADVPGSSLLNDLEIHLRDTEVSATVVFCLSTKNKNALQSVRRMFVELQNRSIKNPVILITDSNWQTADEHLIHFATETGGLFLDGFGDGICLGMTKKSYDAMSKNLNASGRNYINNQSAEQFINNTAFTILQATRTRISKTEYISCPSCGRTLFDLQETTAKIRSRTNHLKGVKIAIMGCIVNGPGEMADADFGYVGSGPGKITLYKGKDIIKRNVSSDIAVDELINLLKENDAWIAP